MLEPSLTRLSTHNLCFKNEKMYIPVYLRFTILKLGLIKGEYISCIGYLDGSIRDLPPVVQKTLWTLWRN